ncbi:MAG: hypothetical protein HOK20_00555, partial [Alphaproteobacteria bacterium]|nr:hypothetical protein [Alphaproteobacteria bacterium]
MRFPKIIELLTISAVLFSGFEASSKLGDAESNSMRDEVDLIAQQLRPADFIQLLSEGQMGELTVERPGHYSAGVLAIKRFLNDPSETDKDKFLEVLNEFMATCSVSGDWGRVAGDLLAESILLGMGIQPKKKPEEVGTFVPSWHFADTNIPTSESVIVSETDGEETWKIDLAKDHSVMAGASAAKMLLDAGTAEDHLLLAMGLLGDNDSLRKTVNQVASDMDAPSGQAFMQTLLVLNQHLKVFVEGTKFVPAKALARLGTFLAMCRHPEDLQGRKEFQKTFFDEIVTMVIDSITRETFNAFEKNEEF